MASKDLEVLALRVESMKLMATASNVLIDLKDHQRAMEELLSRLRDEFYEGRHQEGEGAR